MDKQINEIMDEFNFGRVYRVMQFLDWSWGADTESPTTADIRRTARELLKDVIKREFPSYIYTKGFKASRISENDLRLEFIIEDWEASLDMP